MIGKSEKSLLNAVKILINSLNGIVFLITIPKTGPLNIMIEDLKLFDFEKYAVGGCCFNGDGSDPDIACRECEWEGIRVVQFGD